MSAIAWFQLALGFVKLANWAAGYVDKQTWKAAGRAEAIAEQTAAINRAAGIRMEVEAETQKMSPEDILRDLDGAGELRD